jgi:hypothetical protein
MAIWEEPRLRNTKIQGDKQQQKPVHFSSMILSRWDLRVAAVPSNGQKSQIANLKLKLRRHGRLATCVTASGPLVSHCLQKR